MGEKVRVFVNHNMPPHSYIPLTCVTPDLTAESDGAVEVDDQLLIHPYHASTYHSIILGYGYSGN